MVYRTWAEISTNNLLKNVEWLKRKAGNTKIAPVVKADAYGHGLIPVSKTLDNKVDMFVVATIEEGVALAEEDIKSPVLIIGPLWHEDELLTALSKGLIVSLAFLEQANLLNRLCGVYGIPARVHIQIDTGMNRTGVPYKSFENFWDTVKQLKNLKIEGVYSHFIASDSDPELTRVQYFRFKRCLEYIGPLEGMTIHMANSAAIVTFPESIFDMIRPGISVYGWADMSSLSKEFDVTPVMTVKSRVLQVKRVMKGETVSYGPLYRADKDQWVATIGIGYADLVPRSASNKGYVLIRNKRRKILGAVTMDLIMVEVDERVSVGDEVVILGKQGADIITAYELANWSDTVPYEVLVRIGQRVKRLFF